MPTNYPSSFDTFPVPTSADKVNGVKKHSELHRDMGLAIQAIQAELGANPSGAFSTVNERLANIESIKASLPIGTSGFADGSVTTAKLAVSAVDTNNIANDAVTNIKMANNAIGTAEIIDGAVTTAKVLDGNITTIKIADNNITTAKIADNNITNAKMADNSIGTSDIIANAVTYAKLNDDVKNTLIVSATYTPTLTNIAIGTGGGALNTSTYVYVGGPNTGDRGILTAIGRILLGTSGQSVSGTPRITLPSGFNFHTPSHTPPVGNAYLADVGTATYVGYIFPFDADEVQLLISNAAATYVTFDTVSATKPFTWAAGDYFDYAFSCPVVRV